MDALFALVDVTTLATNVTTLMGSFIGVGLLFLGYKYIKRTMFSA